MKVGIITYHRSHNYGAVLQAYALSAYIKNTGNEPLFIDYWPNYRKGMYDLINCFFLKRDLSIINKILVIIAIAFSFPEKLIRYIKFHRFIKTKFKVCRKTKVNNGCDIKNDCDLYIFGSDQIWRYNFFRSYKGFDSAYWGKYPKSKSLKITYAASMGIIHINPEKMEFIKSHIPNFSAISVREEILEKIIQPFADYPVITTLDPVFLLSPKEWGKIIPPKVKINNKYVLFYNLTFAPGAKKVVYTIAEEINAKVIEITGRVIPFKNPRYFCQTAGPKDFVNLIRYADFVISTSFHGIALSILFKKQFYAMGMINNRMRAINLMEKLQISERFLESNDNFNIKNRIDYEAVEQKLAVERNKSMNFLLKYLRCDL